MALVPVKKLSIPLLVARGDVTAVAEIARRLAIKPDATVRLITGARLAGLTRMRLKTNDISLPASIAAVLEQAELQEFAAAARRRVALIALEQDAVEWKITPLLIKGAANALVYYAQEHWRVSADLDIAMTAADRDRHLPGTAAFPPPAETPVDHLPCRLLAKTTLEIHYRWGTCRDWGTVEDLFAEAEVLPGFSRLRRPSPVVAGRIALLHLRGHLGEMPFDLIDLSAIREQEGNWNFLTELSMPSPSDLTAQLAPGLLIAARIFPDFPPDLAAQIRAELGFFQKRLAQQIADFILFHRYPLLRERYLRSRIDGTAFFLPCIRDLLGSVDRTKRLTGRHPSDPLFWVQHLAILPAKRILHSLSPQLH